MSTLPNSVFLKQKPVKSNSIEVFCYQFRKLYFWCSVYYFCNGFFFLFISQFFHSSWHVNVKLPLKFFIINFGSFTFEVPCITFATVCSFLFYFADLWFIITWWMKDLRSKWKQNLEMKINMMFIFICTICLTTFYFFFVYFSSICFGNSFCFSVSLLPVSLLLSRMFHCCAPVRKTVLSSFFVTIFSFTSKIRWWICSIYHAILFFWRLCSFVYCFSLCLHFLNVPKKSKFTSRFLCHVYWWRHVFDFSVLLCTL